MTTHTHPHYARFAIYRDTRPFPPHHLGDVFAHDALHARTMGEAIFGGRIVVLQVSGTSMTATPDFLADAAARLPITPAVAKPDRWRHHHRRS